MLKAEKKLLLWAERHMLLLTVLMAAALGLYLRRAAVWWTAPDAGALFDRHENNIQSSFYHLVVYAAQYLPALPLHTVKWLAGGADYVVALLFAAIACGQKEKLKHTFCFVVCLLSPVVYLRGICWGQIDSVAFAFLLGAYLLWEKGRILGPYSRPYWVRRCIPVIFWSFLAGCCLEGRHSAEETGSVFGEWL